VPLRRRRIKRVASGDGAFRWYGDYDVPETFGGGTLMLRLDTAGATGRVG
jgi:hypothetical protein